MKQEQLQPAKLVHMHSAASSQPVDFALKETSPYLGGGRVVGGHIIHGDKTASTYDLVERMYFLYVKVVKACELLAMDVIGSLDPFVEVFAFSKDRMQASVLEFVIKDNDLIKDDLVGLVRFDINEVPMKVPPDGLLAPEWYLLEMRKD
ncbi:hypothetical protein ACFX2I_014580 [Malus domestica]